MAVKDGPSQLNLEVPVIGRNSLAPTPNPAVKNIPTKQYLIWSLPIPMALLYDLIRKKKPERR